MYINFCASPCPAVQQQKLLSSFCFGVFEANTFKCFLLRRSVFFTDTGRSGGHRAGTRMIVAGVAAESFADGPVYIYIYIYVYIYIYMYIYIYI